ncbi:MAG: glycosyltransferase family 4 protein [Myxococcales bacterium]|nr:glycosyltransferase family 4 protein [Myxococcales bacterium]
MRIILTVNFSPWSSYCGGGQQSTHLLATALAEQDQRVTVVYTKPIWENVIVPDALPYKVIWAPFVGLRSRANAPLRPLNAVTVARTIQTLFNEDNYDVIHCQGEEGALLPRLRKNLPPFRFIATPRYPSYPKRLLESSSGVAARVGRWWVPPKFIALGATLRGADCCCPTSQVSAEAIELAYGIPAAAQRVVPNGVAPVYLSSTRSADAHRGPILFYGRIELKKGIDVFIEALANLGRDAPPAIVIGRGQAEPWAHQRVQELGIAERVHFLGWQQPAAIAKHLAKASIAVLPSREESFGNAIVEAMVAGTPLITTFYGSIPEVVGASPVTRVDADAQQIANAIRHKLETPDLAEEHATITRKYARERYSWSATARIFTEIYSEKSPTL